MLNDFNNNKQQRFLALDGMRGLLALTVMLNHFIGATNGWDELRPFSGAYISVIYFFIMSGFVLTCSHGTSTGFFKYVLTRLARLWPLYMLSAIMMIGVYYYNFHTGQYYPGDYVFSFLNLLKNLLFLHGVSFLQFNLINDPSWSISIEFWVSLLIPIFFIRINHYKLFLISCVTIIFLVTQSTTGVVNNRYHGLYQFFLAISVMGLGSSLYILFKQKHDVIIAKFEHAEIFLWCCLVSCAFGIYAQSHNNLDFFFILPFVPLMLIDYLPDRSLIKKMFHSNVVQFLGKISFPLYLLHSLILISGFEYRTDNKPLVILGASIVTIFVSYLYYVIIDLPLYKYLKVKINR